jgi:CTP:molybdopterin cytidylyltransferase MocA
MGESGGPLAGLVLTAGASSRWGGAPKAWLDAGGEPAVLRIARVLRAAGIGDVVVVVGARGDEIRRRLPAELAVVQNDRWAEGRTGTVQAGLRWASGRRRVVLWPVDHPFVEAKTVERLLAAAADPMTLWTLPEYLGRGGHPVVVAAEAFPLIEALGPDAPLRSVLPRLGVQVRRVRVDDPGVRAGTDTPEEYRASRDQWRRRQEESWTGD